MHILTNNIKGVHANEKNTIDNTSCDFINVPGIPFYYAHAVH